MIINCPCGDKSFEVEESLIPEKGRLLKCGSCDQTWFFNKNEQTIKTILKDDIPASKIENKKQSSKSKKSVYKPINNTKSEIPDNKGTEIIKYQAKSSLTFSKFLSYTVVFIFSLFAFIILIDTFKNPLYGLFPKLELLLFNFYETLKDVQLFAKDLI
tara:strand:+ start:120 stop:593 length:474 start_codon:yes stop_codon:yes gene_type:complete